MADFDRKPITQPNPQCGNGINHASAKTDSMSGIMKMKEVISYVIHGIVHKTADLIELLLNVRLFHVFIAAG